jgi:hypothetical protein
MSHRHKDDCCCEKKCFVKKCCWEPFDPCCDNNRCSTSTLGCGIGSGSGIGIIVLLIIIFCICKPKW